MKPRRHTLVLGAALILAIGGCRTPLPFDRTPVEPDPEPTPSRDSSPAARWLSGGDDEVAPGEEASPFLLDITPDRLRDLARVRSRRSGGGVFSFLFVADTCVPCEPCGRR